MDKSPLLMAPGLASGLSNSTWSLSAVALSAAVMLVYACVYKRKVVDKIGKVPEFFKIAGREQGILACLFDVNQCLQTFFCLPVVAGKNYAATEACGFWPGCILTCVGTYSPLFLLTAFVRALLSGNTQQRLGYKQTFCTILFFNVFCYPCEIGRESMEVDAELGASIYCCCNVDIESKVVTNAKNFTGRMCMC